MMSGIHDVIGARSDLTGGLVAIPAAETNFRTIDIHNGGYVIPYVFYKQDTTTEIRLQLKFGAPSAISSEGQCDDAKVSSVGKVSSNEYVFDIPGGFRLPAILVLPGERITASVWTSGGAPGANDKIAVYLFQGSL